MLTESGSELHTDFEFVKEGRKKKIIDVLKKKKKMLNYKNVQFIMMTKMISRKVSVF